MKKNSYTYDDLITCGNGDLFGPGNAKLPLPNKILFKKPTAFAKPIAQIQKGRLLIVDKCQKNWCKINSDDFQGWIKTTNIWGLFK